MLAPPQLKAETGAKRDVAALVAKPPKRWWTVALPIIGWQVVALLVVELVLFGAGMGEEEIFKFDPQLGFTHFPDKIVTWRSEGYARTYFDGNGMREVGLTVAKPANTLRIALIGDSMTEGLQVPFEKTYGQLLDQKFKNTAGAGKKIQVVNFGNSGYSTTQECLLLERKVFQYQPDLVIMGYSSRDMIENWSPPDETVSNVRPAALKLPGRDLIIDNSPVVNWLNSPRARFLQSIEWFRHHSRVWGIISATELQLSMKNQWVKSFLSFCTNPVRTSRLWFRAAKSAVTATPAVSATAPATMLPAPPTVPVVKAATEGVSPHAVPGVVGVPVVPAVPVVGGVHVAAAPGLAAALNTVAVSLVTKSVPASLTDTVDPSQKNQYTKLQAATMGGLLDRMKVDCLAHHSKFLVLGMPCRFDLAPMAGAPSAGDLNYEEELLILKKLCAKHGVAFVDANTPARPLSLKEKDSMFYCAHLTPAGHLFVSQQLLPAVRSALGGI